MIGKNLKSDKNKCWQGRKKMASTGTITLESLENLGITGKVGVYDL